MEGRYNKLGRREIDDNGGVWRCRVTYDSGGNVMLDCAWNDGRYRLRTRVPEDWRHRGDEDILTRLRAAGEYPFSPG